jgi:hypothetical protein
MAFVPSDLRNRGISLGRHIHEIAFTVGDSRLVLESLNGTGVVVLGGDFWRKVETEGFRPTYENWYVERAADESQEQFAERSIVRASEEVALRRGTDFLVTMTCEVV